MNDSYTAPSGGAIYAGMSAPVPLPYIAEAGSFVASPADTFTGYRVLATIPRAGYAPRPHGGSVWDQQRKIMWTWGDETHGNANVFRNSLWFFDPLIGKIRQCAVDDPLADYNVDVNGYQWANPAQTRPWAAHGYRAMYYNPITKEVEIYIDVQQHSFVWPSTEVDVTARKAPIYYFNTDTYQWRVEWTTAIDTWNKATFTYGATFVPDRGYYAVAATGVRRVSLDKSTYTSTAVTTQSRYHNYLHVYNNLLVAFGGGQDEKTTLCSVHNLDNLSTSTVYQLASFAALSGYSITNQWSVNMQDGRILFGARRVSDAMQCAFIFDIVAGTVTNTGHEYLPETGAISVYSLKAEWDNDLKCAYVFSQRYGDGTVVLGVKV